MPLFFASPVARLSWTEEVTLEFGPNHPQNRLILVSYSLDSKYLAVGFARLVQVWDLQQLGLQPASPRFSVRLNHDITSFAWIKSDFLVHGHLDGRVGVSAVEGSVSFSLFSRATDVDINQALDMKVFRAAPRGDVSSFAFLGEGRILVIGVGEAVYLWQVGSACKQRTSLANELTFLTDLQLEWRALGSLPAPPVIDYLNLRGLPVTAVFAIDKSTLLVSYAESAVV
ncbi:hypothetical protein AAF712_007581 [Marasmius tenuissimus]|uniref:Uncharacterized protein n=1 Tax=Marasmius tenuissimus TaxID=585030 RepID=A0ABR2ZUI2_9AGAR